MVEDAMGSLHVFETVDYSVAYKSSKMHCVDIGLFRNPRLTLFRQSEWSQRGEQGMTEIYQVNFQEQVAWVAK